MLKIYMSRNLRQSKLTPAPPLSPTYLSHLTGYVHVLTVSIHMFKMLFLAAFLHKTQIHLIIYLNKNDVNIIYIFLINNLNN